MTLTIGCLVVQFFGGPGAGTQALRITGRPGNNFIGIFPPAPKTVQWPPPVALNDQTLPGFSHPLLGLDDAG